MASINTDSQIHRLVVAYTNILQDTGLDVTSNELLHTPVRAANAWRELVSGYNVNPDEYAVQFDAVSHDQIVTARNIPIISVCEHHMLPFIGYAYIAYVPRNRIIGLSKLARIADAYARRLQIQERLTQQIHDCINRALEPLGVAVVIKAQHLCMLARGVKLEEADVVTSVLTGCFRDDVAARQELFQLIRMQ